MTTGAYNFGVSDSSEYTTTGKNKVGTASGKFNLSGSDVVYIESAGISASIKSTDSQKLEGRMVLSRTMSNGKEATRVATNWKKFSKAVSTYSPDSLFFPVDEYIHGDWNDRLIFEMRGTSYDGDTRYIKNIKIQTLARQVV